MPQLFANGARNELASPITATSTSLTLKDLGELYPACNYTGDVVLSQTSDENWIKLVIQDEEGFEIVFCYMHEASTNVFSNLKRGQEGTTARAFSTDSVVGLRPIGGDLQDLVNQTKANKNALEGKADKTGDIGGNAGTATKLKNPVSIGGVLFDGGSNIDLPGVNNPGNQNTTGNAASATKLITARNITVGGSTKAFDGGSNLSFTLAEVGAAATSHTHTAATTTVAGFMSAADKVKLNGIATGATANQTDAQLLSRANHTGTQPISSVAGLQEALDQRSVSVIEVAATYKEVLPTESQSYIRFTSAGSKSVVFDNSKGFIAGQSYDISNRSTSGILNLVGSGIELKPLRGGTLSLLPGDSVKMVAASSTVMDILYGSTATPDSRLPYLPLVNENSTFNDEGTSTTGWTATGGTMAVSNSWLRLTKTAAVGAACSIVKNWTFTPANRDYILYGKVRASSTSQMDATLLAIYNGTKECSIWLGSSGQAAGGGTGYATGSASITGYEGTTLKTAVVAASGGMDYTTAAFEFALQYDTKYGQLNCWVREADGRWKLKARMKCDYVSHTSVSIAKHSSAPTGGWLEFDYLTLCQPNIIAIGDSHCAGSTLFNTDMALSLNNDESSWMRHSNPFPEMRNNLIVNKGVGGQTSTQLLARISEVTRENPRLVFLHASSNDAGTVSSALRTTNVQSTVNAITAANAKCVLLNGLYATSSYTGNPGNPAYKEYMLSWWNTEKIKITGLEGYIDIMSPVVSGGFLSTTYAQPDKVHLNVEGYSKVGALIGSGTDM